VGQLFNIAADIFSNQLTTLFKKREQEPSGGKSLQVRVTIHDSYTRALQIGSDESYELYISEADTDQVMYTDTIFLSRPSAVMLHRAHHIFLFLDWILASFLSIPFPLTIF
jgi:hypothetical protein